MHADAMNAINELRERAVDREERLLDFPESPLHRDSDEENDTTTPITSLFYDSDGNSALIGMTNLNHSGIDTVCAHLKRDLISTWNSVRGLKSIISADDALFMTLAVLKHSGTCTFCRKCFACLHLRSRD